MFRKNHHWISVGFCTVFDSSGKSRVLDEEEEKSSKDNYRSSKRITGFGLCSIVDLRRERMWKIYGDSSVRRPKWYIYRV